MQRKQRGFTIVELLIVIVVIAILAALAVTAYNGITTQANNSKTAAAVQAYKKALFLYAQDNGDYPPLSNVTGACFGIGYPSQACSSAHNGLERASFNTALLPYLGNTLPEPSLNNFSGTSGGVTGALLYRHSSMTLDGVSNPYMMLYVLQGATTKCPVGPIVNAYGIWPNYSSAIPVVGYSAPLGSNGVQCFIPMPDPTKL